MPWTPVCFIAVEATGFLTYETAMEVADFVFDAINFRADGVRPSLPALTSAFFAMWGEYAKELQNIGTDLEI